MPPSITLTVPAEITARAQEIAASTAQTVEAVLLDHLMTLRSPLPPLPHDLQGELEALHHLSDDALWTIARDQMPPDVQDRAAALMALKTQRPMTPAEQEELAALVERADRLLLRKAEAAALLQQRGYSFSAEDYRAPNA